MNFYQRLFKHFGETTFTGSNVVFVFGQDRYVITAITDQGIHFREGTSKEVSTSFLKSFRLVEVIAFRSLQPYQIKFRIK